MSVKVNNIDDIAFIFSFKEIAKRTKAWKETLECACNLFTVNKRIKFRVK